MSKKYIINNRNEEEESNNQSKEINKSNIVNLSNEYNNNLKLTSIDIENNEEEIKILNTIPQQKEKEIELLKQNLIDNKNKFKNNINKEEKKEKYEKENLEKSLNSYIMANKSKEQKILELLEIVNQYETQISALNKQIISLTNSNKQMKDIIKNMEFGYEQTKVNLMTEKEINKNNNTYMTNLYQDKIISEQKIKELINIINQYSGQTEELTKTLNNLKNENINYKKENDEFKNKIFELNEKNNSLENNRVTIQNEIKKLNEEISKLKEDNKKLCEIQYSTEDKMKKNIEEYEKIKLEIKKEENKNTFLINSINQDLESLSKYFDTKYNLLFDEEKNENEINYNFNYDKEIKLSLICFQNTDDKNINNKDINIQLLIKTLINGFNNSKEKIKELKNKNININDKISSLINKEKEYIQQIEKLNKIIIDKEQIIKKNNKDIIELKKEINDKVQINNNLILEKKIEVLNNEIQLKEAQVGNINKLIKIKDDNIYKLKEDNKKLIQDNINLIKELRKYNKKIKY